MAKNTEAQSHRERHRRTTQTLRLREEEGATRAARDNAGITMPDISTIKTHNPFAVNDVYFCREMDVEWETMNNYGSSLVWGHPQGPTGARLLKELIEELMLKGRG